MLSTLLVGACSKDGPAGRPSAASHPTYTVLCMYSESVSGCVPLPPALLGLSTPSYYTSSCTKYSRGMSGGVFLCHLAC
jgi:hypothetical protein